MTENDSLIFDDKETLDPEAKRRREFLKKVGKGTAAVPAVALLMAASAKQASAQNGGGSGSGGDAEPYGGGGSSIL